MFVIEKPRHGRRYTTPLDVAGEREALAELALFERDPEAYLTRAQANERRAAEAVHMTAESVKRFLDHLKAQQRTEKYRRNVRSYLAEWAVPLAGRDLRALSIQELKEVDRAGRGEGELQSLEDQGEIAGTVRLIHTSGDEHVQSLDAQTFAAFQRLVQRGRYRA